MSYPFHRSILAHNSGLGADLIQPLHRLSGFWRNYKQFRCLPLPQDKRQRMSAF